jgi:hypothetical protein
VGSVRFCDRLSRQVQPPDAENRMSGGVAEVTGAIPSPRADQSLGAPNAGVINPAYTISLSR